jgi:hypothetical protein
VSPVKHEKFSRDLAINFEPGTLDLEILRAVEDLRELKFSITF